MSIFSYVDNVLEQHFAAYQTRSRRNTENEVPNCFKPGNHVSNLILTYR